MVFYRRNFVAGGTYFFTATLADCKCDWLVRHVDLLRVAFRHARRERPFAIEALVVLPDHLHSIWTLPPGDADYSHRWRLIKARFSRELSAAGAAVQKNAKREYNVWQRRFWEHSVRDERDLQAHVDYIHYNPVKHGLVTRVATGPILLFIGLSRWVGWIPTGQAIQTFPTVMPVSDGEVPDCAALHPSYGCAFDKSVGVAV